MTDYQAIADRLVERGIGESFCTHGTFRLRISGSDLLTDKEFCHDWRLAGVCMERMSCIQYQKCDGCVFVTVFDDETYVVKKHCYFDVDSLPLAIILAYLEATDGA